MFFVRPKAFRAGERMIKLFCGRLQVSVFALLLFFAVCFSADAPFLFIALFSALLHEMGHLLTMHLFGARVVRISIYPFGVDISADTQQLGYGAEAVVATSGICISAVLAVGFFVAFGALRNIYLLAAVVTNSLFFLVNAFPVRGLDGGRILLSLLLMKLDFSKAYSIFSCVSAASFGLLCFFAFVLLWYTNYNLSLVFICTYLFISEYAKQKIFG